MNKDNEKALQPQDKLDYMPGISVKPIGREGGNWSKRWGHDYAYADLLDHQISQSPFIMHDEISPYPPQPLTMPNAEAIKILENIETDIYGKIAIGKAIDALRGPWVKTADRMPTEADAGYNEEVITFYRDGETESVSCDYWAFVAKHPEYFPYWMPIPPLPEVEE